MFKTKNDLSEATRGRAVELLNARLADCIDLQTQTKQAHWNVKGPSFIGLHELFDKINDEVLDYVDDIAERVVQLGGVAEGTARMVAQRSSLAEYPASAVDGRSHVEALSSTLAAFGKAARKAIGEANELGDLDTADLFTEVSRGIDKWLWFVEAHLQAGAADDKAATPAGILFDWSGKCRTASNPQKPSGPASVWPAGSQDSH